MASKSRCTTHVLDCVHGISLFIYPGGIIQQFEGVAQFFVLAFTLFTNRTPATVLSSVTSQCNQ